MTTQERYDKIIETLKAGGAVIVATCTRATQFGPRHIDSFKLGKSGSLYAKYGRSWLCIDGCALRFGHKA
jgi:hypothetical protein